MGASTPKQPAAPDPTATASAQGQANAATATAQTALQNANVVSPLGSSTFDVTGSQSYQQPDGSWSSVPTYTNTQTLSPQQQQLYDQQTALGSQENTIAGNALTNIGGVLSNPMTGAGLTPLTTSVGTPTLASSYDPGGPIQTSVPVQQADTSFGQTAGSIQYDVADPSTFNAARDATTNAELQRLAPQMQQQQEAITSQLANQGVTQGSPAWEAAMQSFNSSQNDLRLGAVQTGNAEQQALYGEALSSGQFHDAAQQQDYTQQQGRGMFDLQAVGENNAANLAGAQYGLAAQWQQNAENAAEAGFSNTAALQGQQAAIAAAGFGNQATAQELQQRMALRQAPINEVSALMNGGQTTLPQFQPYSSGSVGSTPLSSDTYASANELEQQYQAQMGYAGQTNAGLFGLGSSAFGAAGNVFGGYLRSDRRLKKNAVLLGRSVIGIPVYAFHYVTDADDEPPFIGHMADEVAAVRPDAVSYDHAGFASVDYGAL